MVRSNLHHRARRQAMQGASQILRRVLIGAGRLDGSFLFRILPVLPVALTVNPVLALGKKSVGVDS